LGAWRRLILRHGAVVLNTSPDSPAVSGLPVFSARGLRKVYHTGELDVVALNGVDIDFNSGELVVLLGASGSGKSTLLNILGGLDVPTSGQLSYKGWDLTNVDESTLTLFRRNCVGFVFQFYNLIPSLTARENVALITSIARDPMTPEEALEMVGLKERMDHFPSQRAASSSAWRLHGRLRSVRRCCFATSPRGRWTSPPASRCWRLWSASTASWAR